MKQFYEMSADSSKVAPAVRLLPQDETGIFKDTVSLAATIKASVCAVKLDSSHLRRSRPGPDGLDRKTQRELLGPML